MPQGGLGEPAMLKPARECRALLVQEEAAAQSEPPLGNYMWLAHSTTAGLPVYSLQNKTIEVS